MTGCGTNRKRGISANMMTSTVTPLMTTEVRERAPQFALRVMRAIAPQMGMPPAMPAKKFVAAVPSTSRLLSKVVPVRPSRILAAICVSRIAMIDTENDPTSTPPHAKSEVPTPVKKAGSAAVALVELPTRYGLISKRSLSSSSFFGLSFKSSR